MKLNWNRVLAALLLLCLLPVSALATINTAWDFGVALDTFTFNDYPLTTEAVAAIKDLLNAFRLRIRVQVAEPAGGLMTAELLYQDEPIGWLKLASTKEALACASDFLPVGWYVIPATGEYQGAVEGIWRALGALEPALLDQEAYALKMPALSKALGADLNQVLETFLAAHPTILREVPTLVGAVDGAAKAYDITLDYPQIEPLLMALLKAYIASDLQTEGRTANEKLEALLNDLMATMQQALGIAMPEVEQATALGGPEEQQLEEMATELVEDMQDAGLDRVTATAFVDADGQLLAAQSQNLLGSEHDMALTGTYRRQALAAGTLFKLRFSLNMLDYGETIHAAFDITEHAAEMGRLRTDLAGTGSWRTGADGGSWRLTGHSNITENEMDAETVPISYQQWAIEVTDDDGTQMGVTVDGMERANIPGRQTLANTDISSVLALGMMLKQSRPALQMELAVRFMLDTKCSLTELPPTMPQLTEAVNLLEMDEEAAKKLTNYATLRLMTVGGKIIGDMPPEQFHALLNSGL